MKVLYPRATAVEIKKAAELPLHIIFSDPDGTFPTTIRHYGSEMSAKIGAWWYCRAVGFTKQAVLMTTEELKNHLSNA